MKSTINAITASANTSKVIGRISQRDLTFPRPASALMAPGLATTVGPMAASSGREPRQLIAY
jgi:hypothetical protein